MRALFKQIMKASGTPVLQTFARGVETILSAGNIWTSAHARRIELAEQGLVPGAVLCSELGGFQAVIDFVASTIGGFVYLPVTPTQSKALRQELAAEPIASDAGIMFAGRSGKGDLDRHALPAALAPIPAVHGAQLALYQDQVPGLPAVCAFTGDQLTLWLAALSVQFETPAGGTRMTCRPVHHAPGFVADLLLGLYNRQTIYIRRPARGAVQTVLREAIDLDVDDLVLDPAMLDCLPQAASHLACASGSRLRRTRLHTGGRALSERQAGIASSLFGSVFVDGLPHPDAFLAVSGRVSVPSAPVHQGPARRMAGPAPLAGEPV